MESSVRSASSLCSWVPPCSPAGSGMFGSRLTAGLCHPEPNVFDTSRPSHAVVGHMIHPEFPQGDEGLDLLAEGGSETALKTLRPEVLGRQSVSSSSRAVRIVPQARGCGAVSALVCCCVWLLVIHNTGWGSARRCTEHGLRRCGLSFQPCYSPAV